MSELSWNLTHHLSLITVSRLSNDMFNAAPSPQYSGFLHAAVLLCHNQIHLTTLLGLPTKFASGGDLDGVNHCLSDQ
jgi:hypothetical protein